MAKQKTEYKCKECNSRFSKWYGQCPSCKSWNTLIESETIPNISTAGKASIPHIKRLKDVVIDKEERILTGIDEFDRVVGGGLVNDSLTIITAAPGTGKSTLCLEISNAMAKIGLTVVYASGEESVSQLKSRALRMNLSNMDDIYLSDTPCMNHVADDIIAVDADFVVVDSIQTFFINEFLPSRAGNPTQVMECASLLQTLAKRSSKPRMIMIIGQMNKDDELVGHRALEHLVDTVLIMDGNTDESFRMLFASKNRFGDTGEIGFFQMCGNGLLPVDNPSQYFLTERTSPVIGTALTVLKEGSRPIIIEVESLVTRSFTSFPTRISEVISKDRMNVLLSVLEQHCRMNFFDKNVAINTQNSLRLRTGEVNLAIIMTIVSSYYKKPIPLGTVFLADVGLTGELKKLPNIEMRLKELERMGYGDVYVSDSTNIQTNSFKSINIKKFHLVSEVLDDLQMKTKTKKN